MQIKIFRDSPDAVFPELAYNGTSAAFDLTATETVTVNPGKSEVVPNGLRIIPPIGYYATIHLRSSLGFKKLLRCHQGIIDAGYTGPIGVQIQNLSDVPVVISKGDRYAQVLIHKIPEYKLQEIQESELLELEKTFDRGSKGFGSSGK